MDCIVHGILQARTLTQVAVSFSRGSPQPEDRTQVSSTVGGFAVSLATKRPYAKFLPLFYLNYQTRLQARKNSVSHGVLSNPLCAHGLVARQAPLSMEFSRHEYWSG